MLSIFISFSTADGGDIADHVYRHYRKKGYDVFYSTEEIPYGHKWRDEIKKHVEECDIFLLIATYGAIESEEVAKEIDEAKRLGKRIIPCRPNDIDWSDLEKLEIDLTQGPEFDSKYELVRKIEAQLRREFGSTSVRAPPPNYTRQQETGLFSSSKYEPPSLQTSMRNVSKDPETEYIDRENVDVLFNKAYDLAEIGRYEEAIKYYDKVLKLNPNDATAWNGKGSALDGLGKYEEAIKWLDKAIELKPDYAIAWHNKGYTLNNLGKYEEAIKYYDKAIELEPDFAIAWHNKGSALDGLGKYEEAIKCYDKAIELEPDFAIAWHNKGLALSNLGKNKDADKCFKKARELGYKG